MRLGLEELSGRERDEVGIVREGGKEWEDIGRGKEWNGREMEGVEWMVGKGRRGRILGEGRSGEGGSEMDSGGGWWEKEGVEWWREVRSGMDN
ncbi:hypothetical protein Pcinc_008429 [Petrolisthes cinctipes]|uniref:Uncharacterized protein n=1 Tax=Petrolisthes cinctipes TaxID=88211 RepID=A0AAE1KXA0_PETCI|nr:hypothetical protein Pcinc_008429 [Petrolisthes cinctipes]